MGLTLTLTDSDLPASPAFIEFVYANITGQPQYAGSWYSQEEENLATGEGRFDDIKAKAQAVVDHPKGKESLLRSYRFFKELLTGNMATLRDIGRFRFFFVIGIPRTGGTYLIKQLFRASSIDYTSVQNALAHDGFPHLSRMSFREGANIHTNGLLQLAEYLTMVELFFGEKGRLAYRGGIIVPKKFTKAVYYFDLIRELFRNNSDYLVTLRHPLPVCRSILDKSGGMPVNKRFAVRSAIERWALEDWLYWGVPAEKVHEMGYVSCIIGYWKRFHFQMAMAGLPSMPTARIIPYGEEQMTGAVDSLYKEFGVKLEPEGFKSALPPAFSADEEKEAEKAVEEVTDFWRSLGMRFPAEALASRL